MPRMLRKLARADIGIGGEPRTRILVMRNSRCAFAIARANPADLESLAAVEGMDPFRIEQYGLAILEVLQSEARQQKLI